MKKLFSLLIKCYAYLLRFYPRPYREEFAEEMLLDFSALAAEANKKGRLDLVFFCLHELVDFPISLLQAHLRESGVLIRLRAEPLNTAWRGALAFGFNYGLLLSVAAITYRFQIEEKIIDSIPARLQPLFDEVFLDGAQLLLMGLAFGMVFAILFGDRPTYSRYILLGIVGWLFQLVIYNSWPSFFKFEAFLSEAEILYLENLRWILSGAIWGLIFAIARNEGRGSIRLLSVSAVAYPILTYATYHFVTYSFAMSWRFVSLVIFHLILLGGIFIFTRTFDRGRGAIWIVGTGAIAGVSLLAFLGLVVGIYRELNPVDELPVVFLIFFLAVYGCLL